MAQYSYGQLKEDYESFSNEFAIVRVNRKKISDSRQRFIVGDLAVELTCGFEASIATFSIYNCFDQEKGCFLVDELKKYIAMGSQVEISLGYAALVKPVFVGFIARTAFCYGRGLKINIFYNKNLFILAVSLHLDIPKCFKIVTVGVSKI